MLHLSVSIFVQTPAENWVAPMDSEFRLLDSAFL